MTTGVLIFLFVLGLMYLAFDQWAKGPSV